MHQSLRVATVIVVLAVGSGCAARTPPVDPGAIARATERVRQGCYDCLLEAREVYEGMAAGGRNGSVPARLFEVNLLLALREKELALAPSDALARARALVPHVSLASDAARYVELIEVVPPDGPGTPKRAWGEIQTRLLQPQFRQPALGWLQQGLSAEASAKAGTLDPVVREYISMAVECGRPALRARELPETSSSAPLLLFRRAICDLSPDAAAFERLRADVPAFVETALFVARAARSGAAVTQKNVSAARDLLEEARVRFPRSSAIAYELGVLAQIQGDLRRASGHYSDTLDLQPEHEDARLARALCLTYLNLPAEAVADATALIDAVAYNRGEAYYWRAFNRHRDKELVPARADVEEAKRLALSSRVMTLAGMIEHDQGELDIATKDLMAAVRLDANNCVARWYLGVVKHTGEEWVESGAAFAEAARCYDGSATRAERSRDEMAERVDLDVEFRTRQLAGFEAAIREDRTQESASALNAAIGYARGGDVMTAERYIDQAKKDPARRLAAEDLRQVMKGPQ